MARTKRTHAHDELEKARRRAEKSNLSAQTPSNPLAPPHALIVPRQVRAREVKRIRFRPDTPDSNYDSLMTGRNTRLQKVEVSDWFSSVREFLTYYRGDRKNLSLWFKVKLLNIACNYDLAKNHLFSLTSLGEES